MLIQDYLDQEEIHQHYKDKAIKDAEFLDFCGKTIWFGIRHLIPALLALYGLICLIRGV